MNDLKLYMLNNKKILIIPVLIILVLGLTFGTYVVNGDSTNNEDFTFELKEEVYTENIYKEDIKNDEPSFIAVDIKGRIKKPGVYRIDTSLERRISDIITMAGGLLNDADTSVTNLSKKVYDEMVIIIYSKEEVNDFIKVKEEETIKNDTCNNQCDSCIENNNQNESNDAINNELVNINNASIDKLMTLPGIGESKAIAIVEYREKTPFKSIDEIMNVSGIGESVYNKIKDYITI